MGSKAINQSPLPTLQKWELCALGMNIFRDVDGIQIPSYGILIIGSSM